MGHVASNGTIYADFHPEARDNSLHRDSYTYEHTYPPGIDEADSPAMRTMELRDNQRNNISLPPHPESDINGTAWLDAKSHPCSFKVYLDQMPVPWTNELVEAACNAAPGFFRISTKHRSNGTSFKIMEFRSALGATEFWKWATTRTNLPILLNPPINTFEFGPRSRTPSIIPLSPDGARRFDGHSPSNDLFASAAVQHSNPRFIEVDPSEE